MKTAVRSQKSGSGWKRILVFPSGRVLTWPGVEESARGLAHSKTLARRWWRLLELGGVAGWSAGESEEEQEEDDEDDWGALFSEAWGADYTLRLVLRTQPPPIVGKSSNIDVR